MIESENRAAAPEEQEILAKYTGWGALPMAFDENNISWKKEYAELTEAIRRDIVSIHANRENKMDIFMICIVPDHGKEMTLVFDGKMAQEVNEQAFPGGIAGDHSLTFERSKSSRKKFLIPQLESVLANY